MEKIILPNMSELANSQRPAVRLLQKMGYKYSSNDDGVATRESLYHVVYKDILARKLMDINTYEYKGKRYKFSERNIMQAIADLDVSNADGLITSNQKIYDMLMLGKTYDEVMPDGVSRGFTIKYIDWENFANNEYTVTDEFVVTRELQSGGEKTIRPDIVAFINGIPFGVIECKKSSITIEQGIEQMIRNQGSEYSPQLFKYTQLVMSCSENEAKYATVGTAKKFWAIWKEQDTAWHNDCIGKYISDRLVTEQDKSIISLYQPERLLELVRFFMLFDKGVKKVARYQQYFAVKQIATGIEQSDDNGNRQSGVIWHTQGSGKSLTMVMLSKYIAIKLVKCNPKVVVVTDRIDLDKQITTTFLNTGLKASRATTGRKLIELLNNDNADIITTILNKFDTAADSKQLNESRDIFVLVDEGHRSEYGELFQKMKKVFPNACYLAFTGTPLMKKEKSTLIQFGHKMFHKYTINDAVADKQILPLIYEGRMVEQSINEKGIDYQLELITRHLNAKQKSNVMAKWSKFSKIASSQDRINNIAFDINNHFMENYKAEEGGFKAMLATNSKSEAFKYKMAFDELGDIRTAVVISPPDMREGEDSIDESEENKALVQREFKKMITGYRDADDYEEIVKNEFKHGDSVDMLIVVNKLLTGFDAPRASVLYIDRRMKDHTLLQAIARVNRLCEGKELGFIIDYRGLIEELDEALGVYSGADMEGFDMSDLKGAVIDVMTVIAELRQSYSELVDMFRTVSDRNDTEAYQVMLENEELRLDYYKTFSKFNKNLGYALSSEKVYVALEDSEINTYKKALRFYQELRTSVSRRFGDSIDNKEFEPKLQRLMDNYIHADGLINITKPLDILDVARFEEELNRMGSLRAKADMIRCNITKTISVKYNFNPAYYDKFSIMVQKTIDDYREQRISEKEYHMAMKELMQRLQKGPSDSDVPACIKGCQRAIAFYGTVKKLFEFNTIELSDEIIEKITLNIEDIFVKNVKIDWKENMDVNNLIDQKIEDMLYDIECESGIEIHLSVVGQLLLDVKTIAKNY